MSKARINNENDLFSSLNSGFITKIKMFKIFVFFEFISNQNEHYDQKKNINDNVNDKII
jgi:hypothetical protein